MQYLISDLYRNLNESSAAALERFRTIDDLWSCREHAADPVAYHNRLLALGEGLEEAAEECQTYSVELEYASSGGKKSDLRTVSKLANSIQKDSHKLMLFMYGSTLPGVEEVQYPSQELHGLKVDLEMLNAMVSFLVY